MRNFVINTELVGKVAKIGCKILVYGAVFGLSCLTKKDFVAIKYSMGEVKCSDAVEVITNSDMYSSDKAKVIAMLRDDKDSDFYKTVINVATSGMLKNDKAEAIINMCEE